MAHGQVPRDGTSAYKAPLGHREGTQTSLGGEVGPTEIRIWLSMINHILWWLETEFEGFRQNCNVQLLTSSLSVRPSDHSWALLRSSVMYLYCNVVHVYVCDVCAYIYMCVCLCIYCIHVFALVYMCKCMCICECHIYVLTRNYAYVCLHICT